MKPLTNYIIAVTVVWAVILLVTWFLDGGARFKTFALICSGFAIGMLAMFIAMHVYKW